VHGQLIDERKIDFNVIPRTVLFNFFQVAEPLSVWRNLDNQNKVDLRINREPSEELAEPLVSAEPWLKNTALGI